MAALENLFSWSKSRAEQFEECRRKYYYDKYASWGGWERNAVPRTRLIYVLKNLKNRWAWKGETVHHVIEDVLKSLRFGKPIPYETAEKLLTEIMRRDYRASKAKKYFQDPKRNLGLFEHEYEKGISDAVWKKIHDEAAECLRNFYASALYRELIQDDKTEWLLIEDLEEFEFEGAKIYVKLDFCRRRSGKIEIYDWKTGKSDKEAPVQLGAYALYAMGKWNVRLEDVRTFLVNLVSDPVVPREQKLDETVLVETKRVVSESVRRMREFLSDPAKNVPRPEEDFPYAEDERICGNCSFYKICSKFVKE
jgi:CRISPR/Cas system-associated exonuclease Cas4 (RecB family)